MTTSASLPIMRRIWPQARAEPMPSPSGRACEVTTNRRRARISRRTSSSMKRSSFSCRDGACPVSLRSKRRGKPRLYRNHILPLGAGLSFLARAFFRAAQKLVNATLQLIGTINLEIEFRRPSQPQPLRQFVPDIILGSGQPFEGALGLGLIAGNRNHDPSGTRVLSHDHRADAGQPNARVGQFAFEDGFDLLADGLAQPPAMIFLPTMLHGMPRMEKTCKNIRKEATSRELRAVCLLEARSPLSQELHKRVGDFRARVVGDAGGGAFHVFHQPVKIIAGVRDADHAYGGLIPQRARIEFGNRNVE